MEAVQQLERKQQKPPHSSIPGRAREEQMPPKQMFKVRRSANDQICVVFQVTYVCCPPLADEVDARACCFPVKIVLSKLISPHSEITAAFHRQKVKKGKVKRSHLELRRNTNVPP